jgi:hypothetical protein
VDSSSLDEVFHIPNTLMVCRGCPQIYSFPGSLVYCYLVYLGYWSEILSKQIFLLDSDMVLASIPSFIGSFGLIAYPSKLWETLLVVCTGRGTFVLS